MKKIAKITFCLSIVFIIFIQFRHLSSALKPNYYINTNLKFYNNKQDFFKDNLNSELLFRNSDISTISVSIIRNGNSKDCEVYLSWSGSYVFTHFRFKKMVISNNSLLIPKTYAVIGDGKKFKNFIAIPASKVGSVKISDIKLATSIKEASVKTEGLYGNSMTKGWLAAYEFSGLVKIN